MKYLDFSVGFLSESFCDFSVNFFLDLLVKIFLDLSVIFLDFPVKLFGFLYDFLDFSVIATTRATNI